MRSSGDWPGISRCAGPQWGRWKQGRTEHLTRKEQLDELEKIMAKLRAANAEAPMLVEGERDVAALRELGFEGTILKLNKGDSMVGRAEELSQIYKKIILMTDWDDKGLQLHDSLKRLLVDSEVAAEDFFWLRLRKLCGNGCRAVEDLPRLISALRELTGKFT